MVYLYRKESKNSKGKIIMITYILTDHKTLYIASDIAVIFRFISKKDYQQDRTGFSLGLYGEPIFVADSYQSFEQEYKQEYPEEFL